MSSYSPKFSNRASACVGSLASVASFTVAAVATGVILLIPAASAHAQEGQPIGEIVVEGTKNVNPQVVLIASGLKVGDPFRNDAFVAARVAIRDRGLFDSVNSRVETTPDRKLRVIFEVIEYPVIANIVISGNKSIPSEKLYPLLRIKTGEVLNVKVLEQDYERVTDYYQERGYRAFIDDTATRIDPKTRVLTIQIVESVIESITVTGNRKTKPIVITREFRTKAGSVFNENTIVRDLRRIQNLGLFTDVGPIQSEAGSEPGKIALTLPVTEQRTGQVGVVFGYSTRQRLTGTLELTETNFRGRGQGLNLQWTVGGLAARNAFEIGFSEPYVDKNNTSLTLNVYERILFRGNRILTNNATLGQDGSPFFETRRGGSVTVGRPQGDTARVGVTFRSEAIRANNLKINYSQLSNDDVGNISGALTQSGNLNAVTLRFSRDTRDYTFDPAGGFLFSPSFEIGNGKFDYTQPFLNPNYVENNTTSTIADDERILFNDGSQRGNFTKVNIDIRRYISLNGPRRQRLTEPRRVFATRILAGRAFGNIGYAEQYFLGGAETLRGYADDRFWGNNIFLASAELRLPFDKGGQLNGALFFDIGDAWGGSDINRGSDTVRGGIQDFRQHKDFRPNIGFGVGIRVRTPVGPVRLDYGIGRETGRTHFSIGQTF